MPNGVNNVPAGKRPRSALAKLRYDVDRLARRVANVPYRDSTPDTGSDVNVWVDWASGQLKFRSPDGTVQTLGAAAHGGVGTLGGSTTFDTDTVILTPAETKVFPVRGDNHLAFGPGVCSVMRFVMPALTPSNAEILEVELLLQSLDGGSSVNEIYVGGDAVGGAIPGSYPVIPPPMSYGVLPRSGADWINISRTFGSNLRDGVWNALVITPHKINPQLWGILAGLSDDGQAPQLRITYASEA